MNKKNNKIEHNLLTKTTVDKMTVMPLDMPLLFTSNKTTESLKKSERFKTPKFMK